MLFLLFVNVAPALAADTWEEYNSCLNNCYDNPGNSPENSDNGDPVFDACKKACVNAFPLGKEAFDAKYLEPGIVLPIKKSLYGDCGKKFCLNVPIGTLTGFDIIQGQAGSNNILGLYIQTWYGFLLGTIGIMATVMIMWGGFKYLTSRGDSGAVSEAKKNIISAVTGVALAFGSYTILSLINPALLTINTPNMPDIKGGDNVNLEYGSAGTDIGGEYTGGANSGPANNTQARNTTSDASGANGVPCVNANGVMDYGQAYTASYEGYRNKPFNDYLAGRDGHSSTGQNIGYGHYYPEGAPTGQITHDRALELLSTDYNQARTAAANTFTNWNELGAPRQAVLTDMAYNMGGGIFGKFPNMTAAINAGDFNAAADHMLNSHYASQLPQRSANNANILRTADTAARTQFYVDQASPHCKP